jgi:hypothetical protein
MSDHEPQMGLDTKTYWPTDRQSQCDFDFDVWEGCRELGSVLEMAVEGDWEEMARNELDCTKKILCVSWSYSETVINPLPGYD